MSNSYDIIIVGARCAGAATGMLLARAGAKVLIVDHDQPGTDTMSTHALMRAGVMQLHRWGLLEAVQASGAPPVKSASFIYGPERMNVDIRPAYGTDALYAPRRWALDAVLARAAADAGAEIRYGVSCRGVLRAADGRIVGLRLRSDSGQVETATADLVIGADGRRSTVARLVEAPVLCESRNATAAVYGYFDGLTAHGYNWYWDAGAAGGIIPTHGGQSCVFLNVPDWRADDIRHRTPADLIVAAQALMPTFGRDLAGATSRSGLTAFGGQKGRMRQAFGPGWVLVGDAGYFKDPLSAHGITDALRDAEILADAVIGGRIEAYARVRDELSWDFFRLTDEIASFEWTMDELKALHVELNLAMKLEQDWIASQPIMAREAA